jgi:hypothetical protein
MPPIVPSKAVPSRRGEGFLVFAGATARKQMVESAQAYQKMVTLREELLEKEVLVEDGATRCF